MQTKMQNFINPLSNAQRIPFLIFSATIYLFIPVIIFLFTWVKLSISLPIIGLILFAFFKMFTASDTCDFFQCLTGKNFLQNKKQLLFHLIPILLIIVWLSFSGIGRIGFQNSDYYVNNSLFKELINLRWPIIYDNSYSSEIIKSTPQFLVYYIAFFLPAAAMGKLLGWTAANICLFIWAFLGIYIAFCLFVKLTKATSSKLITAALVFMLFSGLDYCGYYFELHRIPVLGEHLEWWGKLFQFSSNTTLIYWVPQQAIGIWILAGVLGYYFTSNLKPFFLGFTLAAGILWSPLGCIGLFPFIVIYVFQTIWNKEFSSLFTLHNTVSAFLIALVLASYITANQFNFSSGVNNAFDSQFISQYLFFLFMEIGVYILPILFLFKHLSRQEKTLLIICSFVLCFLPLYHLGPANDFVMRGAICATYIFGAILTKVLIDPSIKFGVIKILLAILLILGSLTSISEIKRSKDNYNSLPSFQSDIINLHENQGLIPRLGNPDSFYFKNLAPLLYLED